MTLTLDHIAVLGSTLEQAVTHCEAALGLPMGPGGAHARFGTHNQLLGLAEGLYLEAIAVDPQAPPPPDARWFGLDQFTGPARLNKWICRVDDIAAAVQALPGAGRLVPVTRGALSWTMAVPADGQLPFDGLFPALIQWHSQPPAGTQLPPNDRRLTRLTISHPEAETLWAQLAPWLADTRITCVTAPSASLRATFAGDGRTWEL
ncbi:MAG: VOC family protein [Paracoccaceae bacterium]